MCSSQRLSVGTSPMLRRAAHALAAGVHHPSMSMLPASSCAKPRPWALQVAWLNACCRRSSINCPPAHSLSSSNPAPGAELGKVEKSRCIMPLTVVQAPRELYTRNEWSRYPLIGVGSQVNDSTLECEGYRVGAIVGAQFGQDRLDMHLDGLFPDAECAGNCLV